MCVYMCVCVCMCMCVCVYVCVCVCMCVWFVLLSLSGELEFMSFPRLVSTLRLNDAVPIPVTCCAHGFPAVILTVPSTGDFPGGNVTATPIASSEKETCYTTLFDPALSYHGDVLSFSCTAEYSADIPPCTSGLAGYSTCVSYRNRLTSQVAMFYIYGKINMLAVQETFFPSEAYICYDAILRAQIYYKH